MILTCRPSMRVPYGISIAANTTALPASTTRAARVRCSTQLFAAHAAATPNTSDSNTIDTPRRFIFAISAVLTMRRSWRVVVYEIIVPGPLQGSGTQVVSLVEIGSAIERHADEVARMARQQGG